MMDDGGRAEDGGGLIEPGDALMEAMSALKDALLAATGVGPGWFAKQHKRIDLDAVAVLLDALALSRAVLTAEVSDEDWSRLAAQGWRDEDRGRMRRLPKADWTLVGRNDGLLGVAAYLVDGAVCYVKIDPYNPPRDMFAPGELVEGWTIRPLPRPAG